jgi:hypothetical protein
VEVGLNLFHDQVISGWPKIETLSSEVSGWVVRLFPGESEGSYFCIEVYEVALSKLATK